MIKNQRFLFAAKCAIANFPEINREIPRTKLLNPGEYVTNHFQNFQRIKNSMWPFIEQIVGSWNPNQWRNSKEGRTHQTSNPLIKKEKTIKFRIHTVKPINSYLRPTATTAAFSLITADNNSNYQTRNFKSKIRIADSNLWIFIHTPLRNYTWNGPRIWRFRWRRRQPPPSPDYFASVENLRMTILEETTIVPFNDASPP